MLWGHEQVQPGLTGSELLLLKVSSWRKGHLISGSFQNGQHLKNKHRDYHCYLNSHWGGFRVKALIVAQPMDWFSLASDLGLEISFYSSGLQNKGGVCPRGCARRVTGAKGIKG